MRLMQSSDVPERAEIAGTTAKVDALRLPTGKEAVPMRALRMFVLGLAVALTYPGIAVAQEALAAGAAAGALTGGLLGGPLGAVIGGLAGATAGDAAEAR